MEVTGHFEKIGEQIKHLEKLVFNTNTNYENIQWDRFKNLRILYDVSKGDHMWLSQKFSYGACVICLL